MSAWPHSEGVAWPGRSVRARSSQLHQTKTIAARSLTRGRAPPFELDQRRRLTVGLMETSLNRDRSTRLIHLIHRPPLYRVIPRPGPRGPDRPERARTGPNGPEQARTGPDRHRPPLFCQLSKPTRCAFLLWKKRKVTATFSKYRYLGIDIVFHFGDLFHQNVVKSQTNTIREININNSLQIRPKWA